MVAHRSGVFSRLGEALVPGCGFEGFKQSIQAGN